MSVAVERDQFERDQSFLVGVREIAGTVATGHANEVDRDARFPIEAVSALRKAHALSAFVPEQLGGGAVSLGALAFACFELGRQCASTAMVFAMHQIQVVTIVRHLDSPTWFESYLSSVVEEQRLIASVTSEVGTGGDLGRSIAAVTPVGDGQVEFEKRAPTVSYGAQADDMLTTVRRAPESEAGDQVLALTLARQTSLEPSGTWDTLGMRGTCSPGFVVRARFPGEQVLATPFARVATESLVPVSHILWSHVWLGIATDAFERARGFVRKAARRRPGEPVPAAQSLSRVMSELALLRAEVDSGLRDFCEADEEPDRERLATMAAVLRFNNLKLAASEQTPRVCQGVLETIGIMAYMNDTPFSVGRHLRDSLSARLMVSNDRIHATDAGLLLIAKEA